MSAELSQAPLRQRAFDLAGRVPAAWQRPLVALAGCWLVVFALFFPDWARMADQWWNSSTYNHIVFIPPILAWLVATRRDELAKLVPQGWWPGFGVVFGAAFLWLCGALAGIDLFRQAGVVAMLQGSVLAILGPRVAWGLLFPLAYMVFLVPFGDELVPPLQMVTAAITIQLTEWSGIPAVIDGVFIDTPVGLFEVAEACSGVKFLVAMAALGTLVAHVGFRSWPRRITFMAFALIVPILANGIRAWGTIYIAQSQGVEFAAGFDHIFYGWIFFALVLALVLALAWRFFDRAADEPAIDAAAIEASPGLTRISSPSMRPSLAAVLTAAIFALAAAWSLASGNARAAVPSLIDLPEVPGWSRTDYAPRFAWEPQAPGADHRLLGSYTDADGRRVDVFVALYSSQGPGREAAAFGTGALVPGSDWRWLGDAAGGADHSAQWLLIAGDHKRYAETSYLQGGSVTGSGARLRLHTLLDKLAMQRERTATLILSAEGDDAKATVADFAASISPRGEWLDGITTPR